MTVASRDPNELAQVKEGREFFNQGTPPGYYQPYPYPHPLQAGWEALMKSEGGSAGRMARG